MAGKRITGRTKQLSLKSTPEFHVRLKRLATEEKCLMIEILEKAVSLWETQHQKELAKQEKGLGKVKVVKKESAMSKVSPKKVAPKATRTEIPPTKLNKRLLANDQIHEESRTAKKRKVADE
jgi:hypothetical protein